MNENHITIDLAAYEQIQSMAKTANELHILNKFYYLVFKTISQIDDLDAIQKICKNCIEIADGAKP